MPTYASYSDLNQFFSSANITDWADKDRDGVLNEEELLEIESGLLASEAMIDGYLQRAGYCGPVRDRGLRGPSGPAQIAAAALDGNDDRLSSVRLAGHSGQDQSAGGDVSPDAFTAQGDCGGPAAGRLPAAVKVHFGF